MYRAAITNPSGRRSLVSDRNKSLTGIGINVPCGQCIGCRLERSRQWAVRCMHEASMYDDNCFVTLTYNDDNLPANNSLVVKDLQDFNKRLRKYSYERRGRGFRFYACGEYGDTFGRPHYHILLFDFDFEDKKFWRFSPAGERLYRSEILESKWTFGNSEIGSVSFESAAYVARYITKKVTGDAAAQHYGDRIPEFSTMSRRPGIGQFFFEKFITDIYPNDFVVVRGHKSKPPRFYDKWLEKHASDEFAALKKGRRPHDVLEFRRRKSENSRARLRVKEEVVSSRMDAFKRGNS